MNNSQIVFVGAGNMARSIIGGMVAQGLAPENITACAPSQKGLDALACDFGVATETDNNKAVINADVVILSVKPQVMKMVCLALKESLSENTLIISIAAGINCASLHAWLGEDQQVVRCMPNTPALVQCGASGLYASHQVSEAQKALAIGILSAVGVAKWVERESEIDAVTAVSGSAPAYFFLMLEAMVDAGVEQGLNKETAQQLAIQTAAGAAKLAASSDVDLAELRKRVTSPGGTTEQAILSFEKQNFRKMVKVAMQACSDRAQSMSRELGE